MKYGDVFPVTYRDWNGKSFVCDEVYRYTRWGDFHTDRLGEGLWFDKYDNKQILGTCQFSVRKCATEKSAKAKIRRYVQRLREDNDLFD